MAGTTYVGAPIKVKVDGSYVTIFPKTRADAVTINGSLSANSSSLGSNETVQITLNKLLGKINANATSLGELNTTVSGKADSSSITTLSGEINTLSNSLSTANSSIATLTSKVSTNESNISSLNTSVSDLSSGVSASLETKVNKTDILENNKIKTSMLPDFLLGQLVYGGTVAYNASVFTATLSTNAKTKLGTSSNTITLSTISTDIGYYGKCQGLYFIASNNVTQYADELEGGSLEGFQDIASTKVGDWILATADGWTKIDNTDAVVSVNGKVGTVTLSKSDIGLGNVTNESKETMFSSPNFTGVPTAPTISSSASSVNRQQIVNVEFMDNTLSKYLKTTDISSWAKAASKPTYNYTEIQGKPTVYTKSEIDTKLSQISNVYVQSGEPTNANNGSIWFDITSA